MTLFAPLGVSTSRDLVNTYVAGFNRWWHALLLSIRSCGCRARIVMFVPKDHHFPSYWQHWLDVTGTEVERCRDPPRWPGVVPGYVRDYQRNLWLKDYLLLHGDEFDRVATVDGMDCYFERDPFEFVDRVGMYFVAECTLFRDNEGNRDWVGKPFGYDFVGTIMDRRVINYGTIFGDVGSYKKFYEVMLALEFWERSNVDQAILNYLLYSGRLDRAGVPYTVLNASYPVIALTLCPCAYAVIDGQRVMTTPDGKVPYVIHQWQKPWVADHVTHEQYVFGRCGIEDKQ